MLNQHSRPLAHRNLIACICILLLAGCGVTSEKEGADLARQLEGHWENTYIRVTMNSYMGIPDSVYVLEATTVNWDSVVGIKPIQTVFRSDSMFTSDHYSLEGSFLFAATGTWYFEGDTLVMEQVSPVQEVISMHTTFSTDGVEFSGMLDFDQDGVNDDLYVGRQAKSSGTGK